MYTLAIRVPSFRRSVNRATSRLRQICILAFETSADDTCAAVVTSAREILSNVVIKQHSLHESFGGIHPSKAIEAHQRNLPVAVRRALSDANIQINDVDGIAYTRGPGMAGCLSVGSNAAKNMAAALNKPLVGVHHMQAHALTPFLTSSSSEIPQFPFLTLLISGGHTLLLLANSLTSFRILATTVDESIGRAFDKVSRLLDLKWTDLGPGAALERFCADGSGDSGANIALPRPMPSQLAFSYSGLHSAVERFIFARGGIQHLDLRIKRSLAREFQTAAVAQLEEKVLLGLSWCAENNVTIEHLVVSGGVASNAFLRERLRTCLGKANTNGPIALVLPPPSICTDNAAMIGWASMHRFLANDHDDYSIELCAKWSIEELAT